MSDPTAAVHSDPDILGGTPVFVGTRFPFQNLIDYLAGGCKGVAEARSARILLDSLQQSSGV